MRFKIKTQGHYDFINITDKVSEFVENSAIKVGAVLVFVSGSTAAITTMEYEEGLIEDFIDTFEKIAPENANYKHHQKWLDKTEQRI